MLKNKKRQLGVLALLAVCLLAGCGKADKARTTTLFVEKSGKVTEAIVEAWDDGKYDGEELRKEIEAQIQTLADEKRSVKLKKLEEKDGEMKVQMTYDSLETYGQFNNVVAFSGTIAEAQERGYSFDGEYHSTKDKPSIHQAQLDGSEEYCVLILSDDQEVSTAFDVLYASEGVEVSDGGRKAVISGAGESTPAYLIYKK